MATIAAPTPARRSHAEAREAAIGAILDIATEEFVAKGLDGARIDEIAARTSKRKLYYYFRGKDDLYRAVLERAYRRVRQSESEVDIASGTALDALRRLVEHDVHYHDSHPELVRLVMSENIHHASHLRQIAGLQANNRRIIGVLEAIIARGEIEGSLRRGIDPVELHMNISALAFHYVSNRFTFAHSFGIDMQTADAVARRARQVADVIVAWARQG